MFNINLSVIDMKMKLDDDDDAAAVAAGNTSGTDVKLNNAMSKSNLHSCDIPIFIP